MPKNAFDTLESAVSKGFDKVVAQDTETIQDPDLALYEKMTPEAMSVIAATYGQDNLVRYVQTMEAKRIKAMKKGY